MNEKTPRRKDIRRKEINARIKVLREDREIMRGMIAQLKRELWHIQGKFQKTWEEEYLNE